MQPFLSLHATLCGETKTAAWETTLSSVQIVEKNVSHCLIRVLQVPATPTQMTYDMTPRFKSFTMKENNQFLLIILSPIIAQISSHLHVL